MSSSEIPVGSPTSSENKFGEKLTYDPEFQGPVKSRSCTDILCLFLFVSFLAGWGVVGYFAFRFGDPKTLIYPTDSAGNMCGVDKLESKPYLFFFDLLKCATPGVVLNGCPTPQVCVEKCPDYNYYANANDAEEAKEKLICKYHIEKDKMSLKKLVESKECAQLYLKSTPVLGRCIPTIVDSSKVGAILDEKNQSLKMGNDEITIDKVQKATDVLAHFLSIGDFGAKVFSDLKTSWIYLLVGLLLSMVLSFLFIVLMRWLAKPMIWFSILFILLFLAFGCYYCTTKYIDMKGQEEVKFKLTFRVKSYLEMRKTWLALAIISGVIFGVLLLMIIFLRKRITIALALIKEGSKAVACMPTSLVFPLLPYLLMLVFFALWISIALYISSSGRASFHVVNAPEDSDLKNGTTCNPKTFDNSTSSQIKCMFRAYGLQDNIFTSQLYNLFGLFWGLFFAVGVGQVSLSGAFATYYWTRDKSRGIPTFAMLTGLCRCLRYHLGSIAFGSLLIATVRVIRVLLEYTETKLKKYDNAFTKAILCCMKCFFWCLENFLKFVNKNAYIMIAIYGTNFCSSARKAFMLLMRNILRVVVLDKVTDFLLLFGKLVVVSLSGVASFYFFSTDQHIYKGIPPMNYNWVPVIIITFGAYLIASGFFSVYGMAVDTLFLCFLEDVERNDGSPEKPYLMSKELMKILHKKNKFQELSSPQ